jgi:hypothetical protein
VAILSLVATELSLTQLLIGMQHDKMSVLSSLLPVVVKPGSLGSTTSLSRSVEFVKLSCSWYSVHGLEFVWGVYWPLLSPENDFHFILLCNMRCFDE